jgi:hypothetical protein
MHRHVVTGRQQVPGHVAAGFLRHGGRRLAGALNWDLSTGSRRRPHYYTRESPMQQWLNLVPMAGALLNLAAAMTNLAATIMNRRGTTSDRVDNDIAR